MRRYLHRREGLRGPCGAHCVVLWTVPLTVPSPTSDRTRRCKRICTDERDYSRQTGSLQIWMHFAECLDLGTAAAAAA